MPTNKVIYIGVIVIAASVLMWLGAALLTRVEWILPYTAGAGVLLLFVGLGIELKKKKDAEAYVSTPDPVGTVEEPGQP